MFISLALVLTSLAGCCCQVRELRSSSGSADAQLAELQQQAEENAAFREKVRQSVTIET